MTTLFSDDFENGDLTAWTTTYGSIAVLSSTVRTGQYACSSTVSSAHRINYISKTHTAQASVYLRFYVYFDSLPSGNWELLIARCAFTSSRPLLSVYSDNTSFKWRLRDGGGTARTYTSGPDMQTWYCVELKAVVGDESVLYINGDKILTGTAPSGSSSSVYLMVYTYSGIPDGSEVTFDDVSFSDTYNGPQNLTQTITDYLSTDDPQLCNKQFLTAEYISAAENLYGDKSFAIIDHVTDQERTAAFKQLSINEDLNLSEAANVGIRGQVKTKLFLFLADLAVQLTGD